MFAKSANINTIYVEVLFITVHNLVVGGMLCGEILKEIYRAYHVFEKNERSGAAHYSFMFPE
jgi:hypothetical protein